MFQNDSFGNLPEKPIENLIFCISLKRIEFILSKTNHTNLSRAFYKFHNISSNQKLERHKRELALQKMENSTNKIENLLKILELKFKSVALNEIRFRDLVVIKREKMVKKSKLETTLEKIKISKYLKNTHELRSEVANETKLQLDLITQMNQIIDVEMSRNDI